MAGMSSQGDGSHDRSYEMGMHTEQLAGRTQQVFFRPEEEERFLYPWAAGRRLQQAHRDRRRRADLDRSQLEAPCPHERGIRNHRGQEPARQAFTRASASSTG